MKKSAVIMLIILAVVLVAVAIAAFCFFRSPEYALLKIRTDVQEQGLEGLKPHLTQQGQETVDKITSLAENDLVGLVVGLLGKEDGINTLMNELRQIQWGLEDIMKGSENVSVILSFNYKEKLTGTIEISMIREEGTWLINGVEFPEFDSFDW